MERKHLIAAILTVAVLGTVIVSSCVDENDADSLKETRYQVDVINGSETIDLVINENYFSEISAQYEVEWAYCTDSVITYTNLIVGTDYSCGGNHFGFVINKKINGNVGEYTLTITDTTDSTITDELKLRCIIKGTVSSADGSTSDYESEPAYMIVKISLKAVQLPEVTDYKVIKGGESYGLKGIILHEKTYVELVPTFGDASIHASDYNWYAVGLPNGLAMTNSGKIIGIPTTKNSNPQEVTVYISDINGNTKSFEITFYVSESTIANLTFYLYDGEFTESSDPNKLVHEPSQFLTERGKTVTLAILQSGITVSYLSGSDGDKITATFHTVTNSNNTNTYYCYTLPTDGTGMYRIMMSNADGEKLDAFDLYVLSGIVTVQSGIIVGSSGSS